MIAVIGVSSLWVGHGYVSDAKAFADALIKLFAFYLPFGVLYYVVYRYAADVGKLLAPADHLRRRRRRDGRHRHHRVPDAPGHREPRRARPTPAPWVRRSG